MASTYTPIATSTLGSAANSLTFSSIPSTYTDLILVVDGATNVAAGIYLQVGNGSIDTGSNYSFTYLYGTGSSAISGRAASQTSAFIADFATTQGNGIASIQNYSNTTTYKTWISRSNAAAAASAAVACLWRNTSAINTIKVYADASRTFNAGSTFTLYGIKAA